jgi:hypothetical protein
MSLILTLLLSIQAAEPAASISLFNGQNLDGWYTFLRDRGRDSDPKGVFTVEDGAIRISGEEWGCITTEDSFENYRLVVEFKWGDVAWAPRTDKARDSGVLIHSIGEDGAYGDVWMHSIEVQLIEGGTGDLLVVGDDSEDFFVTCPVAEEMQGTSHVFQPDGEPVTIHGGRINWFGRDPDWQDVKDYRGRQDVEKPVGEWNTLEITAQGPEIAVMLNGVLVNRAIDAQPRKGKIQIQSEGAELFVRRVELTPLRDGDRSDIRNDFDPAADYPQPAVSTAWLYQPETEWTYSHHPHIAWFEGQFYAMWSNGMEDEDAPGQRVLMCTSSDFENWTEPRVWAEPVDPTHTLTAAGFHDHEGTLVGYYGDYGRDFVETQLLAKTSGDGESWSDAKAMGIPVCPNFGPQATASGRLIIASNYIYPWTDDATGLDGWNISGIYPPEMAGKSDDPGAFWDLEQANGAALCEGSFIQLPGGVVRMMLRCTKPREGKLWVTESGDDGATWSKPVRTAFSDDCAKFHFGGIPGGGYYYVGNPRVDGGRMPLVLSLSEYGAKFDRHFILGDSAYEMRRPGKYKGGQYGYPHTLVHEGKLHAIVSRQKEAVQVLRVETPLAEL